ncbi:sialidase family protein [Mechercharimyces sp. CAU 1602]|uniref:sialidase family protein n=1 Tax=Mechercharimyces sp. CAU 1602 TaxID=2973933 RepID=UPI002162FE96|nr:sialidase family protein [Mechercharimyces sp. CAU 1602]MCS1350139.1 glycoside hydrolase [Mechercharimyces sp. CAU 1602]
MKASHRVKKLLPPRTRRPYKRHAVREKKNQAKYKSIQVTPSRFPQNEPSIAKLSKNIVLATANDYRTGLGFSVIGLYRSTDGGNTWSNRLLIPPSDLIASGDGYVDYDNNKVIVSGIAFTPIGAQASVITYLSTDKGRTFSPVNIINRGVFLNAFDKPYLTIDRVPTSPFIGRAYISYTEINNQENNTSILLQHSDDGKTWSDPIVLEQAGILTGSSIAIGLRGEVYVGWTQYSGEPSFQLAVSADGGQTFGQPRIVSTITPVPSPLPVTTWGFRATTFSYLAVDQSQQNNRGRIYAVWMDSRVEGNAHILLSFSDDNGATWSEPSRVDNSNNDTQNFFPAVVTSPSTGNVKIVYYTNRISTQLIDVFKAISKDGGLTFRNERVSLQSFDPNADTFFGNPSEFIGDYIDIDFNQGSIATWMSIPENSQDIFVNIRKESTKRKESWKKKQRRKRGRK